MGMKRRAQKLRVLTGEEEPSRGREWWGARDRTVIHASALKMFTG